ncbi:PNGase F N-terminal domain-containing protein [Carboxylicivirga sp. N1Y90]|uniref:PNGase F N-terminal domain-containing protein n=1 Tax=Carboxylicivirga fragile TaxID=3417571 RepID=UPI003D32556D|nr:hypothetical protein [Marinilabiliaceae bacterium N1Y90]
MSNIITFLTLAFFTLACKPINQQIGNKDIIIFNDQAINFNPDKNSTNLQDTLIKIDNGRIILKKINLPKYSKDVRVSIETTVISAGDPWDKTGSLFLIPQSSEINFLIENNSFVKLFENNTDQDLFPGVIPNENYLPAVEIMRFMTPFGVGYFSNDPKLDKRKPVYIPEWEESVVWDQDITHLVSELEGEVWIGAFIDVWTKEGYELSAKLKFEETKAEIYPKEKTKVIPLVNTCRYTHPQRLYDGFSRNDLEYTFSIPEGYNKAQLYYITTGHGGHSGGDEFVQKENSICINGQEIYKGIPWRNDCASFRRFNPHSGVWTEKRTARIGNLKTGDTKEMEIDEFIASSDYSRSNWCPGSQVVPFVFDIDNLNPESNTITIRIPEAQAEKENELNHWNISAYIVLSAE